MQTNLFSFRSKTAYQVPHTALLRYKMPVAFGTKSLYSSTEESARLRLARWKNGARLKERRHPSPESSSLQAPGSRPISCKRSIYKYIFGNACYSGIIDNLSCSCTNHPITKSSNHQIIQSTTTNLQHSTKEATLTTTETKDTQSEHSTRTTWSGTGNWRCYRCIDNR